MAMRRINLYIEVKTDDALELQARLERVSKAALIRRFVEGGLGRSGGPPPDPIDALVGDLDLEPADIDEVVYGT